MTRREAAAVSRFLQHMFSHFGISVSPTDDNLPGMLKIDREFVGTVAPDEDGDYCVSIPILAEDLNAHG